MESDFYASTVFTYSLNKKETRATLGNFCIMLCYTRNRRESEWFLTDIFILKKSGEMGPMHASNDGDTPVIDFVFLLFFSSLHGFEFEITPDCINYFSIVYCTSI